VAKVVTDGSNVPTITPLANKHKLQAIATASGSAAIVTTGSGSDGVQYDATFALDWARAPNVTLVGHAGQTGGNYLHGVANIIGIQAQSRYSVDGRVTSDFNLSGLTGPFGVLRLIAAA